MDKIIFIVLISFISCQSQYDKNMESMKSSIKKIWDDASFKDLKETDYLEFKSIRYDTITMSTIDSIKMQKAINLASAYINLAESYTDQAKLESEQLALDKAIGFEQPILDIQKDKIRGALEKSNMYRDSAVFFSSMAKSFNTDLQNRENTEKIYRYFIFVKASQKSLLNSEISNTMDTLMYFFDEKMKLISTSL